jgi:hypothetical protein
VVGATHVPVASGPKPDGHVADPASSIVVGSTSMMVFNENLDAFHNPVDKKHDIWHYMSSMKNASHYAAMRSSNRIRYRKRSKLYYSVINPKIPKSSNLPTTKEHPKYPQEVWNLAKLRTLYLLLKIQNL